jgi:hypothetical protein
MAPERGVSHEALYRAVAELAKKEALCAAGRIV